MKKIIRLAITDDNAIIRKGIKALLDLEEDIEVLYIAENGSDMIEQLKISQHLPDIILMDIEMPVMGGFEASKIILNTYKNIKILMLSSYKEISFIEKAIQEGTHGYLPKEEEPEEIIEAIREVCKNGYYFNNLISFSKIQEYIKTGKITFSEDKNQKELFSNREIEIIKAICTEKTDREIADMMFLSENTIQTYRKQIMHKIGTKKSIGIVVYAIKNRIFIP